jgi:hypothetical protein
MRPSVKPFGAFLVAAALLGAACASAGAVRGSIDHPIRPDDLILRIDMVGGFIAPQAQLHRVPLLALYGDGRLIVPGPQIEIYPGLALPNLQVRTVSEAGIQAILAAARAAGLLGPHRQYDGRMPDVPTTTFTVVADGARHVVSVQGLGAAGPATGSGSEDSAAVARLVTFQSKVTDLSSWLPKGSLGPEHSFRTEEMRVYVLPYQAQQDLPQAAKDWPAGSFGGFLPVVDLTGIRCGTVSGSALPGVLSAAGSANELTPWRVDGRLWTLVFRPLLPDESGCL